MIEDDAPVVSITAPVAWAGPGYDDVGIFAVSRAGGDLNAPLTVSITVGGTATPGVDYEGPWLGSPGQVVIPAGLSSTLLIVNPLPNEPEEPVEAVRVTVSEAAGPGAGAYLIAGQAFAEVFVAAPPPGPPQPIRVFFDTERSAGLESVTPARIRVRLSRAVLAGETVSVDYRVAGGTARGADPNRDYTLAPGTLTFIAGESAKTIDIPIVNDTHQELNETIILRLENPANANLAALITEHIYTIVDDEGGLIKAKLPQGANYAKVHQPQLLFGREIPAIKGEGVRVGVIEFPDRDGGIGSKRSVMHSPNVQKDQDFRGSVLPITTDQANSPRTSGHAALVADTIGSPDVYYPGVAPGADLYVGTVRGIADSSLRGAVDYYANSQAVKVFNHSYGRRAWNDNGDNIGAQFLDWSAERWDVVHVKSAGNDEEQITAPGDAYNAITVGATDSRFQARADYSAYLLAGDTGASADRRGKPDILAFGGDTSVLMSNGLRLGVGTSYAAPQVAGTVALLTDPALPGHLRLGRPADADHLAAKAIILNSARKRNINGPEDGYGLSSNNRVTSEQYSDANYLNADNTIREDTSTAKTPEAMRTPSWTPTEWYTNGKYLTVTKPLDDEQGTGVLDTARAIIQHQGGKQSIGAGNKVTPIGWDVSSIGTALLVQQYRIDAPIQKGQFLTVTLCWDHIVDESDGDSIVEASDTYANHPSTDTDLGSLPDFNLAIYYGDAMHLVARSISAENVEHLHVPAPEDSSKYVIQVQLNNRTGVARNYKYGLAWWVGQ